MPPSGVPELVFPSTPTGAAGGGRRVGGAGVGGRARRPAVGRGREHRDRARQRRLPATARATSDCRSPRRSPSSGPDALEPELESMLGLGIDVVEVVDADRLTALLDADRPDRGRAPGRRHRRRRRRRRRGRGADARRGRGGGDPHRPRSVGPGASSSTRAATAVWSADRRGDERGGRGLGRRRQRRRSSRSTPCWPRSSGGSVGARGLPVPSRSTPSENPRGVDVSLLDQAELALVFAQIAPGKVAAPNPALTLRIEVPFSDEQLERHRLRQQRRGRLRRDLVAPVRRRQRALREHGRRATTGEATIVEVADETLVAGDRRRRPVVRQLDVQVADDPHRRCRCRHATRHRLPRRSSSGRRPPSADG